MSVNIERGPVDELDLPPEDPDRHRRAADRRMCAAAYVDADFRRTLLNDVYNDRVRRVAPSHGFDIVVVLRHAWRAWWLEAAQNLVILGVLVVGFVHCPLATLIALLVLAIWYSLRVMSRLSPDWFEYYFTGQASWAEIQRVRDRSRIQRRQIGGLCVALVVCMCASYGFTGHGNNPSRSFLDRTGIIDALIVLAYLTGAVVVASVVRFIWLANLRHEGVLEKKVRGRRMHIIDDQQNHPFSVHSGVNPFIGSGTRLQGWSFAQRLVRTKITGHESDEDFAEPPFTAEKLIEELKRMISGLRDDRNAETRLPGLTVVDHVFVEGSHADPYREALAADKSSAIVNQAVADAIGNPSDVARHYLACRVVSWGGEIVTSVYVHVSLQGRTLYLEFSTYALLPTRQEYHLVDEFGGTGIIATVKEIKDNLFDLPNKLADGYRVVGVPLQAWASFRPHRDYAARKFLRTDIGSMTSVRENVAIESDQSYFQYQDVLQHSKIIERRLLATVGDYLKKLDVDTSEFWQRATAILNNGVINTGPGSVNVTNSALGQETSVTKETGPAPGAQPGAAEGQT